MKKSLVLIALCIVANTITAQTLEETNQAAIEMCTFFNTNNSNKTGNELLQEFSQTKMMPYLKQHSSNDYEMSELYQLLDTRLLFNCKTYHDLTVAKYGSTSNENVSFQRITSEASKADVSKFLKQEKFHNSSLLGTTQIEIGNGQWKVIHGNGTKGNFTLYNYKQLNNTQFLLQFIQSNYSFNKNLYGDQYILEIVSYDPKKRMYKLSKSIKGTSIYEFEYYYSDK